MSPITTAESFLQALPVLRELRSHLGEDKECLAMWEAMSKQSDYQLLALYTTVSESSEEPHQCVGLMGYRILTDFVHGRHLYIDDLVVTSKCRSQGFGERLMREAQSIGKAHGCVLLRLSTGVDNARGKSFYEKCKMSLRAVVYKQLIAQTKP